MKSLVYAIVLVALAIALAFGALVAFGTEGKNAAPLAVALVGAVPKLKEVLDKYLTRQSSGSLPIPSFGSYALAPVTATTYGALMIFGAMQIAGAAGGLVAGIMDAGQENIGVAAGALAFLFVFPACFLIGRWIGRRVLRNGVLVVCAAALAARIVGTAIDLLFADSLASWMGGPEAIILAGLGGAVFLTSLALFGYWRGTRQRLSAYLAFLLARVPSGTREAIVSLAYDEASAQSRRVSVTASIAPTEKAAA